MSTVKAANLQNTGSGAPAFKNSSGTEIGQLVKAWINFDGTGSITIRSSFNISSITDVDGGTYDVNFTNAMSDANYAVGGIVGETGSTGAEDFFLSGGREDNYSTLRTTSKFRVMTCNVSGSQVQDRELVNAIVIGN